MVRVDNNVDLLGSGRGRARFLHLPRKSLRWPITIIRANEKYVVMAANHVIDGSSRRDGNLLKIVRRWHRTKMRFVRGMKWENISTTSGRMLRKVRYGKEKPKQR